MTRYTPKPPKAGRNRFDRLEPKEPRPMTDKPEKPTYVTWDSGIVDDYAIWPSPIKNTATEVAERQRETYRKMYDSYLWGTLSGTTTKQQADPGDYAYRQAKEAVKDWLHKAGAQTTGWGDIIGNDTAKTALLEAIEHPHTHKDLHAAYGIRPPKGVLLYGPPGCGKTMFAKAAASTLARLHGADVEYILLRANELDSKWVGQTEANIRAVFAFARAYQKKHGHPCLIFIDEADAALPNRNTAYNYTAENVATFLSEMDGLDTNGAFIMLATNRPDAIDEAVLRDGRIDRRVKVERPNEDAARQIARNAMLTGPFRTENLAGHLVETLFDPAHLLRALTNPETNLTHHFTLGHTISGAMVVGLVERAKGIAFRRDMASGQVSGVTPEDLTAAVLALYAEQRVLNHDYALREFVETVAIPFEAARQRQAMN